ncbi:MAG: methyltransferase domain-containing protein [Hyphomicrobiales bacterium]
MTTANAPEFLLNRISEDMLERLSMIKRDFQTILLTSTMPALEAKLGIAHKSSLILTMDTSSSRLQSCPGPVLVGDEEELPFAHERLDCIVSALSMQFLNDLPGTLVQARRALKPDGLMMAALLGGQTLHELRESFLQADSELSSGIAPRVAPFTDVRDAGGLLQRAGFALPVADSDTLIVRYDTMLDLISDLRALGWANALTGRPKAMLRRDVVMRAGELYAQNHTDSDGRIRATFQIIWLTGWAPHESQQKPLKPGSAKSRLADALGTTEHIFNAPNDDEK